MTGAGWERDVYLTAQEQRRRGRNQGPTSTFKGLSPSNPEHLIRPHLLKVVPPLTNSSLGTKGLGHEPLEDVQDPNDFTVPNVTHISKLRGCRHQGSSKFSAASAHSLASYAISDLFIVPISLHNALLSRLPALAQNCETTELNLFPQLHHPD